MAVGAGVLVGCGVGVGMRVGVGRGVGVAAIVGVTDCVTISLSGSGALGGGVPFALRTGVGVGRGAVAGRSGGTSIDGSFTMGRMPFAPGADSPGVPAIAAGSSHVGVSIGFRFS